MKSTWNLKDSSGFTLLEVMAAMAVMAVVLTAVFQLHGQSISMNSAARFYTIAPLLGQSKLSEIDITRDPDEASGSGDFGEVHPGYTWQITVNDVTSEYFEAYAEDLKQINVTISLNEDYTYQLRAYRLFADKG